MKTIDKILEYNLTELEIFHLEIWEIINWCWAKWWPNFDKILKDMIEIIPWFNEFKKNKLYEDIRKICFEHDIDYRFQKWFYKVNYKMANKIYKLLHWAKFSHRMSIKITCFILLNRNWKEAYNNSIKK